MNPDPAHAGWWSCAEEEFGVDVSARQPLIKAIALAYCQEKGEAAVDGGAPAGL